MNSNLERSSLDAGIPRSSKTSLQTHIMSQYLISHDAPFPKRNSFCLSRRSLASASLLVLLIGTVSHQILGETLAAAGVLLFLLFFMILQVSVKA